MPVLHFGMTGMLQIRGQPTLQYKASKHKHTEEWPPRFMKFAIHLVNTEDRSEAVVAFCDARRLGRIRLAASPLKEAPISELGFDPILSMPALEKFAASVTRRSCPVKALLLDQSFSAGVGNYLADEILYHARIHPEQRINQLSIAQLASLHFQISEVCKIAVEVNADDSKYPGNWLFHHRWGKGKKANHTMKLPSGEPATIKWITVGGRTSAYVAELQILSRSEDLRSDSQQGHPDGNESELTPLSSDEELSKGITRKRKPLDTQSSVRIRTTTKLENHEDVKPSPSKRNRRR